MFIRVYIQSCGASKVMLLPTEHFLRLYRLCYIHLLGKVFLYPILGVILYEWFMKCNRWGGGWRGGVGWGGGGGGMGLSRIFLPHDLPMGNTLSDFFYKVCLLHSTYPQLLWNRNLNGTFLDKVDSDQSWSILSQCMGKACFNSTALYLLLIIWFQNKSIGVSAKS